MNTLSPYANKKFREFLQNEEVLNKINKSLVIFNITSMDVISSICLSVFLTLIDVNKLNKNDVEMLKQAISHVRLYKG